MKEGDRRTSAKKKTLILVLVTTQTHGAPAVLKTQVLPHVQSNVLFAFPRGLL